MAAAAGDIPHKPGKAWGSDDDAGAKGSLPHKQPLQAWTSDEDPKKELPLGATAAEAGQTVFLAGATYHQQAPY